MKDLHPVTISKEIQFDAGHRVPMHNGKCRWPHGHRYRVIVECEGFIINDPKRSDDGMLVDFGALKNLMMEHVHDVLDHKFIVYEGDKQMHDALIEFAIAGTDADWGDAYYLFPYVPTAENIARWCYEELDKHFYTHFIYGDLRLATVIVWETPTSMARYEGELSGTTEAE